ncbi:MAG TPA: response regulator [Blastocatellia bacterium]|jgi:CheY-like chemotaxis protein|nr:response regulator [Blastocatellia bacterium]
MEQAERVSMVVDDMFFAARINGAASAAGRQVERVRSREQMEQGMAANPPSLLIVDLNSERLDPLQTIEYFKSQPALSRVPIIGFVSHVQTDLIRRAQAAGCDYVLPRSAFTQLLSEIVSGNFERLPRRAP